jgi:type VI secretion system protein ImpL
MKSFLLFLAKAALLVLLALFSWAVALYIGWEWWAGTMIFLAIIAVYLSFKLARRLWITVRSRVKLAQSEHALRQGGGDSRVLSDITAKWKRAIQLLRKSSLKRFGNPLHVLPWYMVVGESGAGKTTAITRSRLASVVKNVSQADPIIQTSNFEWWFFSKAIVIDTAGRYVSPSALDSDQVEWEKLLELLARYRPKEGLDGLVVVIDADRLLQNDSDLLEQRGRVLRERIDQLIRLFDKRFPIYVMVTKCDLVHGFSEWAETLPEDQIEQAMGFVGDSIQGDGAETDFLVRAYAQVSDRLKQLRLDMAVKGVDLTTEILMFPSEIERLRPGLQNFLSACLGNNPYLEQPLFRGLFFSSGRQTGSPMPGMLENLLKPKPAHATGEKGFFLHDFFGAILPRDRGTFLATQIVNRWRQVTRNLAWVVWFAVVMAFMAFVLVSYAAVQNSLRQIEAAFPRPTADGTQEVQQIRQRLTAMQGVVDLVLEQEQKWETRWLAFSPAVNELEDALKAAFVNGMKQFFTKESAYGVRLREVLADPESPTYPDVILGLTRFYNKGQAGLRGTSYPDLLTMPAIPTKSLIGLNSVLTPDVVAGFDRLVSAYFAWSENYDEQMMLNAKEDLNALTAAVFAPGQMAWLLAWADAQDDLPAVTLNEFWIPGSIGTSGLQIRPAFTRAGEARIQSFLQELGQALNNSSEFQAKRRSFERWYQSERINAWHVFTGSFSTGEQLLVSETAWREMIGRVNKRNSPFYTLLARLNTEFAPVPRANLPGWLVFARDFGAIRREAQREGVLQQAQNVAGVFNSVGGQALQDSVQNRSISIVPDQVGRTLGAVDAYRKFITDFNVAAADVIEGEGKAYQMAADLFSFGIDPNTKASTLKALQDTFTEFRTRSGYNNPDDAVLWPVVGGPLHFLVRYVIEQASCSVQKDWEKNVLWRTQTAVSAKEIGDQLFGAQGSVWSFAGGAAKPFLTQKGSLFEPLKTTGHIPALGYTFPFGADFVPFLNQSVGARVNQLVRDQRAESARGKSVKLSIAARPLGVNPGAKAKPFAAVLTLQCSNEETVINNFNVQASDTVTWSPDLCGDVSLQVKIDNLSLVRRYPGALGLARLIEEFQDGERVFTPEDFPSVKDKLDALDVRTINVRYDFLGQEALLKLAEDYSHSMEVSMPTPNAGVSARRQLNIPDRVGQCWAGGQPKPAPAGLTQIIEQRAAQVVAAPSAPTSPTHATQVTVTTVQPVPPASSGQTHRVVAGDTLSQLALTYKTDVQTLKKLNGLSGDTIRQGDTLKLP